MYPSGGAVYAVINSDVECTASFLDNVRGVVSDANTIKQVTPSVEDLFFLLISEKTKIADKKAK
jgi:hypothetical protein